MITVRYVMQSMLELPFYGTWQPFDRQAFHSTSGYHACVRSGSPTITQRSTKLDALSNGPHSSFWVTVVFCLGQLPCAELRHSFDD
jgi:hypothetical protein